MSGLCIVILTFNSERSLRQVVESCHRIGGRFVVVDSYSSDGTVDLAKSLGCEVFQHPFENYSKQRNWAEEASGHSEGWFLHIDSDEVLSPELRQEIYDVLNSAQKPFCGYIMRRVPYFMGRRIRHGMINPTWHLRLYEVGKGTCENRLYDQHYVLDGVAGKLKGELLDLQIQTIEGWTASHNRWSTAEALEASAARSGQEESEDGKLQPSLFGDARMKKRWLKTKVWYKMPLLVRPFLTVFYSYFIKLGFLDGKAGLVYHVLRDFWFRFLVDAKLLEMRTAEKDYEILFAELDKQSRISIVTARPKEQA